MKVITLRFEVEEKIGSGGMSTVYRARDRETRGVVALKVLRRGHLADIERFDREARVLADLTHPSIVRYVAHGETEEGDPYLAMEWLDGVDLAEQLRASMLGPRDALRLGVQVAEALGEAHAHGIIHRDIKPSNIFLQGGQIGRVKLLDFGMARWSQVARMATITGTVLGTPAYMAPEQARGDKKVGPQADVFALGCVLFECLTGQAAFAGDHMLATLSKLLLEEPPRIRRVNGDVPAAVAAVVEQMMERDPSRRPANGVETAERLGEIVGKLDALGARPSAKRSVTGRSMTPAVGSRVAVATAEDRSQALSKRLRRPSSKEMVAVRPVEAPPAPRDGQSEPPRSGVTPVKGEQGSSPPSIPPNIPPSIPPFVPPVIASSQVSVPSPSSRKKRRSSPPPRRAFAITASLNALLGKPSAVGPITEAVLAVLGKHLPMPWAMLKAQCDRIGVDAYDLPADELPAIADVLLKAASKFVGRAERTEMLRALLELYYKG